MNESALERQTTLFEYLKGVQRLFCAGFGTIHSVLGVQCSFRFLYSARENLFFGEEMKRSAVWEGYMRGSLVCRAMNRSNMSMDGIWSIEAVLGCGLASRRGSLSAKERPGRPSARSPLRARPLCRETKTHEGPRRSVLDRSIRGATATAPYPSTGRSKRDRPRSASARVACHVSLH